MKKRILAIMMAALLSASVMSGCTSSTDEKDTSKVSDDVQTSDKDSEIKDIHDDDKENDTDIEIKNLTKDLDTENDENYSISSYEPVQKFSYELLKNNVQNDNPVLSPVSAYLAISMAAAGAEGNTKAEFLKVLGDDMLDYSGDMVNKLVADKENFKLNVANSAWIDTNFTANENWLLNLSKIFKAQAYSTKLSSSVAQESINGWIDEKTDGLIKDLLSKPLPDDTRLALINTVYFKAEWESKFMPNYTQKMDFVNSDDEKVSVDMMQKLAEYCDYIKDDTKEGVILPYAQTNLAFVALKPTDDTNVRQMLNQLTVKQLSKLLDTKENVKVNLKLPKFDITFDKTLNDSLQIMGINDAFDGEYANFSNMGADNIYISLVKQKAVIKVDEDGTEASAATQVIMSETSVMQEKEPIDIFFDEPFLYMIMDMDSEVPLFIGIMDNPIKK